eukprot:Pgem_evm1s3145
MTNEFELLQNSFVYLNDKGFAVGQEVPFTDVNGKESLRVEYDHKYKRGVLEHHKEGKIFTLYSSFNPKTNKKVVMYNCLLCNSCGIVGRRATDVGHLNNHCLGKKHIQNAEIFFKVLADKTLLQNEKGEATKQNVVVKRKKGFSTLHGFFKKKVIVEAVEAETGVEKTGVEKTGVEKTGVPSVPSASEVPQSKKEKQRVPLNNCVGVFEDFRAYSSSVRA